MSILSKLESILFVASKSLALKKIAAVIGASESEVGLAIDQLRLKYNNQNSGIVVMLNGQEVQMMASPDNREIAENFMKSEVSGDLTRPQLETLTVISYCGPITKPELEQIRGVNCGLILRNLMLRGLVKEADSGLNLLPTYEATMDYLKHLGITSLTELPDYDKLHNHPYLANEVGNLANEMVC